MYVQLSPMLINFLFLLIFLRFYGAVSNRTMRPEVSYADLRAAPGNTGNVEENKSLYWNPVIYKVVNPSSASPSYQMVDVWFASAYYVWRTGQAKAFPPGLKMKASGDNKASRVGDSCGPETKCKRTDNGGCTQIGANKFFPKKACGGENTEINTGAQYDFI